MRQIPVSACLQQSTKRPEKPALCGLSCFCLSLFNLSLALTAIYGGMNLCNINQVIVERKILQPDSDGKASKALALSGIPKARAYVVDAANLFLDEQEGRLLRHNCGTCYGSRITILG